MNYYDLQNSLKEKINYADERIDLGMGLCIRNFAFQSRPHFPPFERNEQGGGLMSDGMSPTLRAIIERSDSEIEENLHFRYHLMLPPGGEKTRNVILMFHGFNEKYWFKYLPWAAYMALATGKAVLMFPIAFHMNRAPALWSDARAMYTAGKERRAAFPDMISSSLSNVAISSRLHDMPERFVSSGMETYHDVIDLVRTIKSGQHPAIDQNAAIDFFSYSIGTFLGEILMMTNTGGYFSNSRYASFCGGPVFNRLSPVSKSILDSEAGVRLYSYLVEHLDSHIKNNRHLGVLFSGDYPEGTNLKSLLSYKNNLKYREDIFRSISDRFYAIALEQDEVVPPYEVINTLKGSRGDIGIRVDVLDYPYPYKHEDPFPANLRIANEVDKAFRDTFSRICEFLGHA